MLSLAPAYAWEALRSGCSQVLQQSVDLSTWEMDGRRWLTLRNERLQHVLSHMNHHIHPLKDDGSGERGLLAGCKKRRTAIFARAAFPLMQKLLLFLYLCVDASRRSVAYQSTGEEAC